MSSKTLSHYLSEQHASGVIDQHLQQLLMNVAGAVKDIAAQIAQGAIAGVLGAANSHNIQGEEQKKLDIIANTLMLERCAQGGAVAAMASEEMDTISPVVAPEGHRAAYLLLFDPLDGSSNIDVNVSVGTIFSVLPRQQQSSAPSEAEFLQAGRAQAAAGYAIYGPATMLVLTLGQGTHGFTLDHQTGEFLLTHPGLTIVQETAEFAINASNERHWETPVQRYISDLKAGATGPRAKNYNMRWIASMVADVHRILMRGGIFMYPLDAKCQAAGGKLRLMYEANPMALLIEQAGGAATMGTQRLLEVVPERLHQRVPVILGSADEVDKFCQYYRQT